MSTWSHVIAEPPYDKMGAEFMEIFSGWLDNESHWAGLTPQQLSFDLFRKRLALAEKHNTYFATQMANDVWQKRYIGDGFNPCYSFAIKDLSRTKRFWDWTDRLENQANSSRVWDTDFAPYPSLPMGPHTPYDRMLVWEHTYRPHFEARQGGALKMRRIRYSENCYLFEHVRNNWVPLMRQEAHSWWNLAVRERSAQALASFEWVSYWTNIFGRAAALTTDAMSLIVQKHHGFKMRGTFYHQDQEALLMSFEDYVGKRSMDMNGRFVPYFDM